MSEIKPRQWTVKWDKIQITENYYEGVQIADGISVKKHESVEVVEAEPVLQMMKEMADWLHGLNFHHTDCADKHEVFNKDESCECGASNIDYLLEKYKSFLSQIESEGK